MLVLDWLFDRVDFATIVHVVLLDPTNIVEHPPLHVAMAKVDLLSQPSSSCSRPICYRYGRWKVV